MKIDFTVAEDLLCSFRDSAPADCACPLSILRSRNYENYCRPYYSLSFDVNVSSLCKSWNNILSFSREVV